MSKLVVVGVFIAGLAVGKYGCGASAPRDRVKDLEKAKDGISELQGAVGQLQIDGVIIHGRGRDRKVVHHHGDAGVSGTIVVVEGMMVDPDSREVVWVRPAKSVPVDVLHGAGEGI